MKHLLTGAAVVAALAFSAPVGRQLDGYAGSQPRWAGSDAVQHGRASSGGRPDGPDAYGREEVIRIQLCPLAGPDLRHNVGDTPDAPPRAPPPRVAWLYGSWPYGPWPEIADGYDRTAQPSRARPPAARGSSDSPHAAGGPAIFV